MKTNLRIYLPIVCLLQMSVEYIAPFSKEWSLILCWLSRVFIHFVQIVISVFSEISSCHLLFSALPPFPLAIS